MDDHRLQDRSRACDRRRGSLPSSGRPLRVGGCARDGETRDWGFDQDLEIRGRVSGVNVVGMRVIVRLVLFALLVALTGCAHRPPMAVQPAASSCRAVVPDAARAVLWMSPDDARDRDHLVRWCQTVGPVLVASPGETDDNTAPAAIADRIAIISWNVHVGGGDIDDVVSRLRRGEFTGDILRPRSCCCCRRPTGREATSRRSWRPTHRCRDQSSSGRRTGPGATSGPSPSGPGCTFSMRPRCETVAMTDPPSLKIAATPCSRRCRSRTSR